MSSTCTSEVTPAEDIVTQQSISALGSCSDFSLPQSDQSGYNVELTDFPDKSQTHKNSYKQYKMLLNLYAYRGTERQWLPSQNDTDFFCSSKNFQITQDDVTI